MPTATLYPFPTAGALPWLSNPYCFAGWVPTISGHLSFSLIGGPEVTPRCRTFNRPISAVPARLMAVHQRRTVQDYVAAPRTIRAVRPQTCQDYVLVARTGFAQIPYFQDGKLEHALDEQGVLFGNVIVLPPEKDPTTQQRREKFFRELRSELDRQTDLTADPEVVIDSIIDLVETARVDGVSCLALEFALFRTGEVRIWYSLEHLLGRQVHPQAIPPSPEELELAEAIAPQVYFFIKDVTHIHYHHEPDSDQLLPLTRLRPVLVPSDHDANELSWRRETMWGLARVVSQFRRRNKLYDFKRVMGLIAYADAFQATLASIWRRQTLDTKMETHGRLSRYDFAHTKSSVEAMESLATWRKSGGLQFFAIMAGVILSSVALWAGAIQVRPILCPPPAKGVAAAVGCETLLQPRVVSGITWVVQNPIPFTLLIFLFGYAAFILVFRDITFVPLGKRMHRFFSRVSKAVGTTVSRWLGQDSALADWLGYIATLLVLAIALVILILLAAYGGNLVEWMTSLFHRLVT